jgi:L-2-amino-thiazoline-4-carboxylic acid hydrolase
LPQIHATNQWREPIFALAALSTFQAKSRQPGDGNLFYSSANSSAIIKRCCKNERLSVDVSVIQQAKIQAQVLVPLVKALQAELGEERANALVRRALGDLYRRYGEEFWRTKSEKSLGKVMASAFATYAREDALDYTVIEQSQDAFEIDVTGCRYAEFYKELGEPELGFLLVCTADFTTAEGFGEDIKLTRTQTIMRGASHCDFRYKRLKETD